MEYIRRIRGNRSVEPLRFTALVKVLSGETEAMAYPFYVDGAAQKQRSPLGSLQVDLWASSLSLLRTAPNPRPLPLVP